MKKENSPECDEKDYLHHYMIEQINRITVEEQEEQMKNEIKNNKL